MFKYTKKPQKPEENKVKQQNEKNKNTGRT